MGEIKEIRMCGRGLFGLK